MMKRCTFLICSSLIAFCFASGLWAGDDLFLVSPQPEELTIFESELLANDEGALSVTGYGDPLYGTLAIQRGKVVYTPLEEFWDWGVDCFKYDVDLAGLTVQYSVYLIADDGVILSSEDFEAQTLGADWSLYDELGLTRFASHDPIEGQWSLAVSISPQASPFVMNTRPADPRPDGKVGHGLDPGGDDDDALMHSGEVVILRGLTQQNAAAFEVGLLKSDQGSQLCPRAWQSDGSAVYAPCAPIPNQPVMVVLGWGRMPDRDANAGLMYLLVDGSLVALVQNLDNSSLLPSFWQFGQIEPSPVATGEFQLDRLAIWLSPQR